MSVRVETFGDATLYLGDCRDLEDIVDGDYVVISDPPYSIPHDFGQQSRPDGSHRSLSWEWDKATTAADIIQAFAPLFNRVSAAFVFCGLRQSSGIAEAMFAAGMTDKMAVWTKPFPPPPAPGNWWPSACELAVYGYRSGAFFGDARRNRSNVFHFDALRNGNGEKNGHPTQKPLALMLRIVAAICSPTASVFDPFMGSGTTGVAALRLGRRFVGIEVEPNYFDIACRRIDAEARQGRLDIDASPYDEHADAVGSWRDAIEEIGKRVHAGEPLPEGGYFGKRPA